MGSKLKNGQFTLDVKEEDTIWRDKKRRTVFALPISFTTYTLTHSRIIVVTGFLNTKEEEVQLYRVRDIGMTQSLIEKLNNTGTLRICSTDASAPELAIRHVKNARKVKEAISQEVEICRKENSINTAEVIGGPHVHEKLHEMQ